jgi:hypothetical protein
VSRLLAAQRQSAENNLGHPERQPGYRDEPAGPTRLPVGLRPGRGEEPVAAHQQEDRTADDEDPPYPSTLPYHAWMVTGRLPVVRHSARTVDAESMRVYSHLSSERQKGWGTKTGWDTARPSVRIIFN